MVCTGLESKLGYQGSSGRSFKYWKSCSTPFLATGDLQAPSASGAANAELSFEEIYPSLLLHRASNSSLYSCTCSLLAKGAERERGPPPTRCAKDKRLVLRNAFLPPPSHCSSVRPLQENSNSLQKCVRIVTQCSCWSASTEPRRGASSQGRAVR